MFILINAPEGVLNDECSVCGIFRNKKDAQCAMLEDIRSLLEEEADDSDDDWNQFILNDYSIDDTHGTCYLSHSDAPEWHIFEV